MKAKWTQVAWWEYVTKVRTKTFLFSLFVTPIFAFGMMFLPSFFATRPETETRVIGVIDETGVLAPQLDSLLMNRYKLPDGQPAILVRSIPVVSNDLGAAVHKAQQLLAQEKIVGYLIIQPDIFSNGKAEYRSENIGNLRLLDRVESALKDVVMRLRIVDAGINPDVMKKLETPIDLKAVKVTKTGEIEKGDPLQLFFTSFAFLMLMFFLIITTGQMLVRSTIEEKTNRIVEVLVSSAPSTDLMVGKIIGLSGLGLTQVLVWTAIGLFIAMSAHVVTITVWQLLLCISYFILGYLFFAALFVAIGSVLTTEQEAQQWMQYLSMVFAIPLVFAISGIENPNAVALRVLEFIPLFTPMIMALRIPLNAMPVWEIVRTIFVLSVSVIATMWAAGKVFRVGILIYGKKPSFDEIIRWLRSA